MSKENTNELSDDQMNQVNGGSGTIDNYSCASSPDDQTFWNYYSKGIPNDCPNYRPKRINQYCPACFYCSCFKG